MPVRSMFWTACLLLVAGCGAQSDRVRLAEEAEFEKARRPTDPLFVNFEANWRERISKVPELALPVRRPETPPREAWEPIVISECVFSPDVGALVPQTTLTWNDPVGDQPRQPGLAAVRTAQTMAPIEQTQQRPPQPPPTAQTPQSPQSPALRVDLAVHYEGFSRNYYSTALSTAARERFSLPSNSGLVADSPAVLSTGPALFPRLMDFRAEMIQDRDSGRQLRRQNIVLRDLSEGMTYQIRLSAPGQDAWSEIRHYTFLTPVCPKGS